MEIKTSKRKIRPFKWILGILAGFSLVVLSTVLVLGATPPKVPVTPSGQKQMQSLYVPMEDGTRIAVRVYLPADLSAGERVPAILEDTRYTTEIKPTFLLNVVLKLGGDIKANLKEGKTFIDAGYAYVRIDARGSGASFGSRDMEWSTEEIADIGQVIDWIVGQSWSSGQVATYGVSYSANTAELAVELNHPNLVAVVPLYSDFEPMNQNIMPGGIPNSFLIDNYYSMVSAMDADRIKGIFIGGIAPVDGDKDGKVLDQAIQERHNADIAQMFSKIVYFDDYLNDEYTANSLAPFSFKKEIERSNVPYYVRVGWMDAGTVDGAIERYLTFSNSQQVTIGPWNHSGDQFYDPFVETAVPTMPLQIEQANDVIDYLDRIMNGDDGMEKEIHYYTMGEGVWKTTTVWPVEGMANLAYYFYPDGSMSTNKPESLSGSIQYTVNYSATTGENNRWRTNLGGGPIIYPDRSEEDTKLLTFTSEPLENDIEITGNPVVSLNLSSNATDGAIYVYLEDVSPDGKVTYITEGELRLLHRKISSEDLGHVVLGPKHSYLRRDGQEITPGENVELEIGLYATSVLINKGHMLRVAISGHDASNFNRIPKDGEPIIEMQTNAAIQSFIRLPMKTR